MDRSDNVAKWLGGVLAGLLLCFGLQALLYHGLHLGTGKTESNYFSTMSRFQAACPPGADLAVAGSSISGRLPGREAGNPKVSNLGSDGGSPIDGMKLVQEGLVGRPEWLVVETNTLFNGAGYAEKPAVIGARGIWFAAGGRFPLIAAGARPSGMFYGLLLNRKWRGSGEPFVITKLPADVDASPPAFEYLEVESQRLKELVGRLRYIRNSGVKVLLVNLPAGQLSPRDQQRMEAAVATISTELKLPYLDLAGQIPRESLVFTDSVHLGPSSAARVLDTLQSACRKLDL
jgi:hypothetical protein